jgi:hypothetical protein
MTHYFRERLAFHSGCYVERVLRARREVAATHFLAPACSRIHITEYLSGVREDSSILSGLLSEGHLSGWNLLIEATRQARGECGERQGKDARIVQYACFLGESIVFRGEQ